MSDRVLDVTGGDRVQDMNETRVHPTGRAG
jgi:hypothetical protein